MYKIKAIGFDWGGVIYGKPSPTYVKAIAKILQIGVDKYKSVYSKHNSLVNIKSYSSEKFWPVILKELGRENKYDEVMVYLENRPAGQINKSIVELISKLKKKGYKLGILSNNTLEGGIKIKQSKVANYFDVILISAEIGYMKPQKETFNLLLNKLRIKPNKLLFIDDTERTLSSAKEIGYYPLIYSGYAKLVKDLEAFGILT